MIYRLADGRPVELTRELGRGGEGVVYEVKSQDRHVAKIWHTDANRAVNTTEAAEKVLLMVRHRPDLNIQETGPHPQQCPCAVWPEAVLYDDRRRVVGFLMPRVNPEQFKSSFRYFNPASRRDLEQQVGTRFHARDQFVMARNLALAMGKIHRAGYVVGDVNEENLLVNHLMEVTFVDTDSMQVLDPASNRTFRCTKGREDYTPPRLQGVRFREHDRTTEDDLFGLAVLVFKITMQGVHPYASTSNPDNENAVTALGEKIRLRYFPYNESGYTPREHQPSAAYHAAWQNIPFDLRHLFRLAFDPDAAQGRRPTPDQWAQALNRVIGNVRPDAMWETPTVSRPQSAPPRRQQRPTRQRAQPTPTRPMGPPMSPPAPARSPATPQSANPPGLSASAARARYSAYQAATRAGRPVSLTPVMDARRLLVGSAMALITLPVLFTLLEVMLTSLSNVYMNAVPACQVTTGSRVLRVVKVAPERGAAPGNPDAINWADEGVDLVEGSEGHCVAEGYLDPNLVYLAPDGTEVDFFGVDGESVQAMWAGSDLSTADPALVTLLGTLMMVMPLLAMLAVYAAFTAIVRGLTVAPTVDIMISVIMGLMMVGMRMFGLMGVFEAYDGDRYLLFSSGMGSVFTVVTQFWIMLMAFHLVTVVAAVIRGQVSHYNYNRP